LQQNIHEADLVLRSPPPAKQGSKTTVSELTSHDELPAGPLAEVGRFLRLNDARERGLVIAAMERPHWIVRQDRIYVLSVEARDRDTALAALAEFENDERARVVPPPLEPLQIPVFAVVMTLLVMILFYTVQQHLPAATTSLGVSDDARLLHGEWWRAFTALTLHGDLEHLVSNLSLAIFVFAFLYWRFRVGVGLAAIIVAGALGNFFNALAHLHHPHFSLGSSTALFAGLGLLSGAELAARLANRGARNRWSLIVPLGAGITFLSLYGGGGVDREGVPLLNAGRIDVLAHLFGLAAGLLIGLLWCLSDLRQKLSRRAQAIIGALGLALLAVAWLSALRAS
jgi:rhomboid protease GluP